MLHKLIIYWLRITVDSLIAREPPWFRIYVPEQEKIFNPAAPVICPRASSEFISTFSPPLQKSAAAASTIWVSHPTQPRATRPWRPSEPMARRLQLRSPFVAWLQSLLDVKTSRWREWTFHLSEISSCARFLLSVWRSAVLDLASIGIRTFWTLKCIPCWYVFSLQQHFVALATDAKPAKVYIGELKIVLDLEVPAWLVVSALLGLVFILCIAAAIILVSLNPEPLCDPFYPPV